MASESVESFESDLQTSDTVEVADIVEVGIYITALYSTRHHSTQHTASYTLLPAHHTLQPVNCSPYTTVHTLRPADCTQQATYHCPALATLSSCLWLRE